MSRHREPDQLTGVGHYQQLEVEAWLLGAAVPETLGAELLARSDDATVYRVVGPDMSSLVVKIVSPDTLAGLRATFDRLGAHAALVPMLASGVEQQLGYAVFPYYAQTLADRIEAGPIGTADLGHLLAPVADALAMLHRNGIGHADVKPSNIMLTAAGNAVLADLDEAAELGSIPRRVTVGFCPPEQLTAALRAGQPAGSALPGRPAATGPSADAVAVQPARQVLAPVVATTEPAGASVAPAAHPAEPPLLTGLVAAAQQVWGFGDLRAVTIDRLALQLQPAPAEPEEVAAERPIWRHPAMIVSMALAAVLILLGIGLTVFG